MHTNLKGVALFICAAIYPVSGMPTMSSTQREDVLYDTVGTLLFSDEQKVDLYSRLAESLTPTTTQVEAMSIIEKAIHICQTP